MKRLLGIALALFTASCAAVPTLNFAETDASAGDAGDAATNDGGPLSDGNSESSAEAGTCPNGFNCCQGTPRACENTQGARCNQSECVACEGTPCAADTYCCALSPQSVVCHALDASCP